jgi:hypothetical protein
MTEKEEREFGLLRSLTPAQELQVFLSNRGQCLMAMGRRAEALQAHTEALRLCPESRQQQIVLAMAYDEATEKRQVAFPSDPILQISGDDLDWIARRAEIISARNRGEMVPMLGQPRITIPNAAETKR